MNYSVDLSGKCSRCDKEFEEGDRVIFKSGWHNPVMAMHKDCKHPGVIDEVKKDEVKDVE